MIISNDDDYLFFGESYNVKRLSLGNKYEKEF